MSVYVEENPTDMCNTLRTKIFDRLVLANGHSQFDVPATARNIDDIRGIFDTFVAASACAYVLHDNRIQSFNVTVNAYAGATHILTGRWTIIHLAES